MRTRIIGRYLARDDTPLCRNYAGVYIIKKCSVLFPFIKRYNVIHALKTYSTPVKFNIKRILITRASYSLPPQPVIKCFRFMLSTVHRTPLPFSPLFSPQQFIKWCAFHGWSAGNIKRQLKTILPRGSSKCIRYRFRNFPSSERSIRARHLGESRES